jgi:hypothetical protein
MIATCLLHGQGRPPAPAPTPCCTHKRGLPTPVPCCRHRRGLLAPLPPSPSTSCARRRAVLCPSTSHAHVRCPCSCSRWVPMQYVQYPIYFYNIKMKHLQYTSAKQLKHLQHTSETSEKICVTIAKYMQQPDKTLKTYV